MLNGTMFNEMTLMGELVYFYNLAKVNTVPCMCAATLSRTASRQLDSSSYIESITDAYT